MSFSNYLETKVLDHIFGGDVYTRPTTLKIGLSTVPLNDDGTGAIEPTDPAYERVSVSNSIYDNEDDTGFWENAIVATEGEHEGKGVKVSAAPVEFPAAEEDWGTIVCFFITDDAGVVLGSGALAQSKTVLEGDVVMFAPGDLVITLD